MIFTVSKAKKKTITTIYSEEVYGNKSIEKQDPLDILEMKMNKWLVSFFTHLEKHLNPE